MTDYAPELLLGDPYGEYKALTCVASGAITKGDPVTISKEVTAGDISSTPSPTVVTSSYADVSFGIAMKSAADGAELPVLIWGITKAVCALNDTDAGDSLMAYNKSTTGVYPTTAHAGFAVCLQALASGDSGLIWIPGGLC